MFSYEINSPAFTSKHSNVLIAIVMGVFAFTFYFCNNLLYWLYSLKQWTISIEVPHQIARNIEEGGIRISETCYNSMKWIGILINLLVTACVGVFRYLLCLDILQGR